MTGAWHYHMCQWIKDASSHWADSQWQNYLSFQMRMLQSADLNWGSPLCPVVEWEPLKMHFQVNGVLLHGDLAEGHSVQQQVAHLSLCENLLSPFLAPAKPWQQLELGRSLYPLNEDSAPESSLRCTILHLFCTHWKLKATLSQSHFYFWTPLVLYWINSPRIIHTTCCSWTLCDLKMYTVAWRTPWYH